VRQQGRGAAGPSNPPPSNGHRYTMRPAEGTHPLRRNERLVERLWSQLHTHAAPGAAPCAAASPAALPGRGGPSPRSAPAGRRAAPPASGAAAAAAAARAVDAGQRISAGSAAGVARGVRTPVVRAPVEGELDGDGRRRARELGTHRGRGRAGRLDRLRHLLRAPTQASGAREGCCPYPTAHAARRPRRPRTRTVEIYPRVWATQPPQTQFPSAACR